MSREDKKTADSGDGESGSKNETGASSCPSSTGVAIVGSDLPEHEWICHPVIRPELVPSEVTTHGKINLSFSKKSINILNCLEQKFLFL